MLKKLRLQLLNLFFESQKLTLINWIHQFIWCDRTSQTAITLQFIIFILIIISIFFFVINCVILPWFFKRICIRRFTLNIWFQSLRCLLLKSFSSQLKLFCLLICKVWRLIRLMLLHHLLLICSNRFFLALWSCFAINNWCTPSLLVGNV